MNDIQESVNSSNAASKILGALRLIAAVALSWWLVIILTPPNKPVENGLQLLFPGLVIICIGIPAVFISLRIIKNGAQGLRAAVRQDIAVIAVIVAFSLLHPSPLKIMIAAVPFAIDAALMLICSRKLS